MRTKRDEIRTDDPGTLEEADAINAAQPSIDLLATGEVLEQARELAKAKRFTLASRLVLERKIAVLIPDDEQTRSEYMLELVRIMDGQ